MAFNEQQISPLDTYPGTGIGISIPFNSPGVFKTTYTTREATKINLINFFLVNKGEIYMNPLFGGDLRNFIFQQISSGEIDNLKQYVQQQISIYFPQIIIESLNIDSYPDINQINIVLKYNILNTGITDVVEIAFT